MVNMITALCGYFSGTFVSDTGGTFKSDTPGTFVSDIGGTFEVILSSEIKDFVHFGPTRDPQLQDWVYYDVIFPDKINNYRLYRGEFYTNKVDVTFKKSPDL